MTEKHLNWKRFYFWNRPVGEFLLKSLFKFFLRHTNLRREGIVFNRNWHSFFNTWIREALNEYRRGQICIFSLLPSLSCKLFLVSLYNQIINEPKQIQLKLAAAWFCSLISPVKLFGNEGAFALTCHAQNKHVSIMIRTIYCLMWTLFTVKHFINDQTKQVSPKCEHSIIPAYLHQKNQMVSPQRTHYSPWSHYSAGCVQISSKSSSSLSHQGSDRLHNCPPN